MMTLSKNTIELLKNFYSINQAMVFKKGNTIQTVNMTNSIIAEAEIADTFPQQFAIYDLMLFLSCLNLWGGETSLSFEDKYVIFTSGKNKLKYVCSSPSMITTPSDRRPNFPFVDIELTLTKEDISSIMRTAGSLSLKDLKINSQGIQVFTENREGDGDYSNVYTIDKDVKCKDDTVEAVFQIENLKIFPVDYKVSICSKGIAYFESLDPDCKVKYYIALAVK